MSRVLHCLGWAFVILGATFTLSPEVLEHSPVGFEKRGAVHHIWHYMILLGGLALLIGLALCDRVFEVVGLVACGLPIVLNAAAALTAGGEESLSGGLNPAVSGFGIALRVIVLAVIAARLAEIYDNRHKKADQ